VTKVNKSDLGFLPEKHTDFVFAVIEYDFINTVLLIILVFILIWYLIKKR